MGNLFKNSEKGQILLIVVLAAVISLTVGLSVASRTITNTKTTTEEISSQKALSAAEAGLEQKLKSSVSTPISGTFSNQATYNATTTGISGTSFLLNGGNTIKQVDGADIWLSTYPTYASAYSGTLTIYWSDNNNTDCTKNAAIEIAVISGALATPGMQRYAYDDCASRRSGNGFTGAGITDYLPPNARKITAQGVTGTFNHSFSITINVPATGVQGRIARVIPLYADTTIAVESSVALPAQGDLIQSEGSAGNTKRKVRVFKGYPRLPTEYFPYSIFLP